MDRLEAMVHLEQYGNIGACSRCGHTTPSLLCSVEDNACPILVELQKHEPEDDVKAIAARVREGRGS